MAGAVFEKLEKKARGRINFNFSHFPQNKFTLSSKIRDQSKRDNFFQKFDSFRLVGTPGFEPGLNLPKRLVLPLHYVPIQKQN